MSDVSKKIRVGWFSFSCCEDSTIVFTELLNDHWKEWKDLFEFRHARVLRSKNVLVELDIAFVEGAVASESQAEKVKEIRAKSKKLVAIGACAVTGMPAGQRNFFDAPVKEEIKELVDKFQQAPKVMKLSEIVKVDAEVGGCPMDPNKFLEAVGALVKEFQSQT